MKRAHDRKSGCSVSAAWLLGGCQKQKAGSKTPPPPSPAANRLHLVLAHIIRIQALEPFLQPLGVSFLRREVHGLRVVDHGVLDEDWRARPERQRDCVA